MSARNKSSNHIGKLNLFEKTIKSARSLNIYRDWNLIKISSWDINNIIHKHTFFL